MPTIRHWRAQFVVLHLQFDLVHLQFVQQTPASAGFGGGRLRDLLMGGEESAVLPPDTPV